MSPDLDCLLDSPKILLDLDIAVSLGLIVSEMITNALKHAYDNVDNPELKVLLLKSGNDFELLFSDNGCCLSEDFNLDNPESLGLEIITALTLQIDGEIECFNNEKEGASFKILLKNKLIEYSNFQYQPSTFMIEHGIDDDYKGGQQTRKSADKLFPVYLGG